MQGQGLHFFYKYNVQGLARTLLFAVTL